jgi:hypothetical protein
MAARHELALLEAERAPCTLTVATALALLHFRPHQVCAVVVLVVLVLLRRACHYRTPFRLPRLPRLLRLRSSIPTRSNSCPSIHPCTPHVRRPAQRWEECHLRALLGELRRSRAPSPRHTTILRIRAWRHHLLPPCLPLHSHARHIIRVISTIRRQVPLPSPLLQRLCPLWH